VGSYHRKETAVELQTIALSADRIKGRIGATLLRRSRFEMDDLKLTHHRVTASLHFVK
jgi:hypothetical protein